MDRGGFAPAGSPATPPPPATRAADGGIAPLVRLVRIGTPAAQQHAAAALAQLAALPAAVAGRRAPPEPGGDLEGEPDAAAAVAGTYAHRRPARSAGASSSRLPAKGPHAGCVVLVSLTGSMPWHCLRSSMMRSAMFRSWRMPSISEGIGLPDRACA